MALSGDAAIDFNERRHGGGSLRLSGGSSVAEKVDFKGNPRSLEFFLKAEHLPAEGQGCLPLQHGRDVTLKGEDNLMSLYLNAKGEFKLKYIYQDHQLGLLHEKGVMELPQKRVEPGRWTHVSIHFLLNEWNTVRFMVDGEILDEAQMYTTPWTVRLVVGNSTNGGQPFNGWIDELRVAGASSTPKMVAADSLPRSRSGS